MAARRDFLLVSAGRFVTALIGIITIRIATTYLSPAQYGELAMLIAVQAFCGLFLVNPVGQHINRHTHQWWDDGTLLHRLASYRKYVWAVAVIGAIAEWIFLAQPTVEHTALGALAMLLMVSAATWNATYVPLLNMLGFRSSSVRWAIVTVSFSLLASYVLVIWVPTAIAWFIGQALGMSVGALGASKTMRRHAKGSFASPTAEHALLNRNVIFNFCLPLAVATGFMWLQLSGYRFVVSAYWGVEMLGFVAVGLLLAGQLFSLFETLAQQFLFPLFYRRINQADRVGGEVAMSDLMNLLGPLYLVLAGSIYLGAPYILKLLVAEQYADAEIFVRFGAGIECCRVLGNLLGQAAQITKQTSSLAPPYAAGAMATIGLMLLVGQQGVSVTWVGIVLLFAALTTLISMGWAMYRQVAFRLDAHRWLSGMAAMLLLCLPAGWLAQPTDWIGTIVPLVMIGMVSGGIIFCLMRNSEALRRLLAVKLREGFE